MTLTHTHTHTHTHHHPHHHHHHPHHTLKEVHLALLCTARTNRSMNQLVTVQAIYPQTLRIHSAAAAIENCARESQRWLGQTTIHNLTNPDQFFSKFKFFFLAVH